MSFEKLSADCARASMISAYNHLRHFVMGRTKELEERILNLKNNRNKSNFLICFGTDANTYLKDLDEQIALVKKGNYDKVNLIKYLERKIFEIDSLRYLSKRRLIL